MSAEPGADAADLNAAAADPAEKTKAPKSRPLPDRMIEYAGDNFTVFKATDGRTYGVRNDAPTKALALGKGEPLINEIKAAFAAKTGSWPANSTAQAAVTDWLHYQATLSPTREVPHRCTWDRDNNTIYLDTGDRDWTIIRITGDEWKNDPTPPYAFRRSGVTAALPTPEQPAVTDPANPFRELWTLTGIAEDDRPLILAALVSVWMTRVAQPVVYITGEQDSGKSTVARYLLSLVDPVTIGDERGGKIPPTEEDWKPRVAAFRAVFIDNASHITAAQSDTLCRVATGGESTTRQLYTDDTAHLSSLRAPVWLTSIGVGVLRGDLQSRMVQINREPLNPDQRMVLSDLTKRQDDARPRILHALLDLTRDILALLPAIDRHNLTHRLTDYALIVRCIDKLLGTDGERRLTAIATELAEDVIEGDIVAQALLHGIEQANKRMGAAQVLGTQTPAELLRTLTEYAQDNSRSSGWPRTPKVMSEHLGRIAPALAEIHGITFERRLSKSKRLITVRKRPTPAHEQTTTHGGAA